MPLILVPTPIGNLEDITLRALRVLRSCDVIACEDTRTTSILLNRYGIKKPLVSYHAHNEQPRAEQLLQKMLEGKKVALVSDAGTPGISDPGYYVLKLASENNIEIDVLPGANALLPALLLSGLPPHPFLFYGFPPEKEGQRKKVFEEIANLKFTLCFYLSPHKGARQIGDMSEILGDRRAALVREISKIYQEAFCATLSEIKEKIEGGVKGELVLIVEGAGENDDKNSGEWRELIPEMIENGLSVKDIVEEITKKHRVPKNLVKDAVIAQKLLS